MKFIFALLITLCLSNAQSVELNFGIFNPNMDKTTSSFHSNMYAKAGYSYNVDKHFEVGFLSGMYTNEKNEFLYKGYEDYYVGIEHKFNYKNVSIDLYTKYAFFSDRSSPFVKVGASKQWDKITATIRAESEQLKPSLHQTQLRESFSNIDKFISIGYDVRMAGSEKYSLPIRISFEFAKHFGGTDITFINKSSLEIKKVPHPEHPNSGLFTNKLLFTTLTKKLNIYTVSVSLIMPL